MTRAAAAALLLLAALPAWGDFVHGQVALRRGDPEAARVLGFMLGRGVEFKGGGKIEARPEEAAKWYRVGADRGDVICADVLGAMLAVGRGTPRDSQEALRRFRQAGRDVDAKAAAVARFPEEDREEIQAWFLALNAVMRREVKQLRAVGPEGKAVLEFHADPAHVKIEGDLPDPRIADVVTAFGKETLLLAPPPPAAVRHRAVSVMQFVFH